MINPESAQVASVLIAETLRERDMTIGVKQGERFAPLGQLIRYKDLLIGSYHVWTDVQKCLADKEQYSGPYVYANIMGTARYIGLKLSEADFRVVKDIWVAKCPSSLGSVVGTHVESPTTLTNVQNPARASVSGYLPDEKGRLSWHCASGTVDLKSNSHTCATKPGLSGAAIRVEGKTSVGVHYGGSSSGERVANQPNQYSPFDEAFWKVVEVLSKAKPRSN